MDTRNFDDLTRSVVTKGGTRRALVRLLAGGALAGLMARLRVSEDAAAKPKHKKAQGKQRQSRVEQKGQGQLQAEGKRRKKREKRDDNKPNKKPKTPQECGPLPTNYCGTCEKALCVAGDWICASNGEKDCGGGVCVGPNACCPGQKLCPGYTECFAAEDCCPDAVPPLCEPCTEVVCEGGSLHCRPKPAPVCSPCQELTCENDEKWACTDKPHELCPYPNWVWDSNLCRCVCAEDYVDCGVRWVPSPPPFGRWVGKCSCHLADGKNYCDEDLGMCCSLEEGCDN